MVKKIIKRLIILLIFFVGIYVVTVNMTEKEVKKIENISIR